MVVQETVDAITELYGESLKRITIERIVIGVSLTGVKLSNGYGGISYTPASATHQGSCCPTPSFLKQKPLRLKGMTVYEVLSALSDTQMFNTLKIVVLNALSTLFLTNCRYIIAEDCDALDIVNIEPLKKACMIGVFIPFLERFEKIEDIKLRVIERKRENLRGNEICYYEPAEDVQTIVPTCDTVIIAGSAIANGTMDELLSYVKPGSTVIVTGPMASFLPDAFFKRNVSIVSGVSVTRPDKVLDMLAEGMGAYHLFGEGVVKKINVLGRVSEIEHVYEVA